MKTMCGSVVRWFCSLLVIAADDLAPCSFPITDTPLLKHITLGTILLSATCLGVRAQTAPAQTNGTDYLTPFPAHHVIANVYFVGSKGLGIYLVTTPQGHILINAGVEDSVPLIQQSVEKQGFRFSDVRILLISHAHFDHDAGAAKIKQLTGAKYFVMEADVPVVETGGKDDFFYGDKPGLQYPATKVDRVLHDGDTVRLGDTVLTASSWLEKRNATGVWLNCGVRNVAGLDLNQRPGL